MFKPVKTLEHVRVFKPVRMFKESAGEFKAINSLTMAGLLLALRTVLAVFLSIQVTPSMRISVTFLANVVIGVMFGPVMGCVCGGVGDVIQFIIKPTGPYSICWTVSAALSGLLYGLFFYHRYPRKLFDLRYIVRTVIALTIDTVFINVLLGTLWCAVMYGKGFEYYFLSRFVKNIIQLPINVFLTYALLYIVKKTKK